MNTKLTVCTVALIAVLGGLGTVSAQSSPTPTVEQNTSSTTTPTATPTTTSSTTTVTPTAEPPSTPTPASTEAETPSETVTPEPTSTPTERSDNSTYQIAIDDDVRVVSSSWSDGELTALIEADRPSTLVVTDASKDLTRYEATNIKRQRVDLPHGTTEVTFTVEKPSSAAVTAATSDGIVGLSPGDGSGWFDRAAEWVDVRAAAGGAAVFSLLGMLGGVWWSVSKRRVDGVEVVDTEETND